MKDWFEYLVSHKEGGIKASNLAREISTKGYLTLRDPSFDSRVFGYLFEVGDEVKINCSSLCNK